MKKTVKRIIVLTLFLAVFLFVIFTVLSRLGGSSPVLKDAIQDFLTNKTSYITQVSVLNGMHFFPDVVVDVSGVEMSAPDSEATAIYIGRFNAVIGFFDVMGGVQKYKSLYIENSYAAPGTLFASNLRIEHGGIFTKQDEKPHFRVEGKVGAGDFTVEVELDSEGQGRAKKYFLGQEWGFDINVNGVLTSGRVERAGLDTFHIKDFKMNHENKVVLQGALGIERLGAGAFKITGQLKTEGDKSVFNPDIVMTLGQGPLKVTGKVDAPVLTMQDFGTTSALGKMVGALLAIPQAQIPEGQDDQTPPNLSGLDVSLDMNVGALKGQSLSLEAVPAKLEVKEATLKLDVPKAQWHGANANASFVLDTGVVPLTYEADFALKAIKNADIKGTFSGESKTLSELPEAIGGDIIIIGQNMNFSAEELNGFADGLGDILGPLNLSCGITDFGLINQKASIKALIGAGDGVEIQGDGFYDFKDASVDAVLHPKTSAGVSAIYIKGALEKLSAKKDTHGGGGSGLAKGARDPDAAAIELDMTLGQDHPCHPYVIEKEKLSAPEIEAVPLSEPTPEPVAQ